MTLWMKFIRPQKYPVIAPAKGTVDRNDVIQDITTADENPSSINIGVYTNKNGIRYRYAENLIA